MQEIENPKIFPCTWKCPDSLVWMSGLPWKHRTPQWDENLKVTWSHDGSWQVISWHLETLPREMPVHCQSAVIIRRFMPAWTWISAFVSVPPWPRLCPLGRQGEQPKPIIHVRTGGMVQPQVFSQFVCDMISSPQLLQLINVRFYKMKWYTKT